MYFLVSETSIFIQNYSLCEDYRNKKIHKKEKKQKDF